ncbi:MAG: alanine/ornithine racemase family PLP-dependent enzyme [Anaerolineaceae bacterium]
MYTTTPRLEIYPERIQQNAQSVLAMCHKHGAKGACVSKVLCAEPAVLRAFVEAGTDMIADSRLQNLKIVMATEPESPRLLLRLPTPGQAEDVVKYADLSLNSSLVTIRALAEAAKKTGKQHQVILMVDLGDLREGVWPDRVVEVAKAASKLEGIDLVGLGANLACYGGVVPTVKNMELLIACRDICRKATGLPLELISGGNSSSLPLLASGLMPKEINHFRIGEAIILGRNVLDRSPWQGTRQDTLRVVAEVIELETKPSVPIGERGQDAFGNEPVFEDRGLRKRAILNIGRQDVVIDGLEPLDPWVIVLGGSSDHLVLDVSDAEGDVEVGDEVTFYPNYSATLAASTSPFVKKVIMSEL